MVAGHQSAPVGLEWLPSGLKDSLRRIDLGKMILDPVLLSKLFAWIKSVGASYLYFPSIIGNVREVGGNGEALVNSTADVAGYNSYVIYHWALLQLSTPSGRLYSRKSQTKRDWNHLVLKVEILIDQNQVMLVPNMSCTLAQISHHDLVLHSKSMACSSGLLESIDTTTRLI